VSRAEANVAPQPIWQVRHVITPGLRAAAPCGQKKRAGEPPDTKPVTQPLQNGGQVINNHRLIFVHEFSGLAHAAAKSLHSVEDAPKAERRKTLRQTAGRVRSVPGRSPKG
jgi:hypothetical protein